MINYGNLLTLKNDWKALKKGYWKAVSKLFKMFPSILGLTSNYVWVNFESFIIESYQNTKFYTLELLRLGKLEDEDSDPSGEMIKWIQESVNKVHPKSFLNPKAQKKEA